MGMELLWASDEQIDSFMEYMELTNTELPPIDQEGNWKSKMMYYLHVIEAFDNNPKKAAKAFNAALEKAETASFDLHKKMLDDIPNITFKSAEDVLRYEEQLRIKPSKVFTFILEECFYNICREFREKQMDKWQTTH